MGNANVTSKLDLSQLRLIVVLDSDIIRNTDEDLIIKIVSVSGYFITKTYKWHDAGFCPLGQEGCHKKICVNMVSELVNITRNRQVSLLIDTRTDTIVGLVKDDATVLSCLDELNNQSISFVDNPVI